MRLEATGFVSKSLPCSAHCLLADNGIERDKLHNAQLDTGRPYPWRRHDAHSPSSPQVHADIQQNEQTGHKNTDNSLQLWTCQHIDTMISQWIVRNLRQLIEILYHHLLDTSAESPAILFLWFSLVPPGKCQGSTSFRPRPIPSKSFPIHHLSVILSSDARVVGIATGYGLDDQGVGVRVPVGARIFSSQRRPNLLWAPLSLISSGYRGLFPRGVKLTTHFQLVPRSKKCGSIHPLHHTPSRRSA
jgi:hypothetical protein